MTSATKSVCDFGRFRYDAEQRLLFRDGQLVPLVPKALDTLDALIERRGRVVDKAELMRLVWPDAVVEDVGLARNISLLRRALGDDAEQYIQTIPKRGYRFVADVEQHAPESAPDPAPAAPDRTGRRRWRRAGLVAAGLLVLAALTYWQFYRGSRFVRGAVGTEIAVVPFTCMSPEIGCGTFARGFTEILVADLSKQDGLRIVSPSTVERYRRARISMALMGRMLGLEVLIEGTVQRVGDRLRFTARLGDIHSGQLIWADTYEYPAADADRAQTEAARAIAAGVAAKLAGSHGASR